MSYTRLIAEDEDSAVRTLRAYRETDGALSRVAVSQWARPGGRPRHMDVLLTLPSATVWQFNGRSVGNAWRELPCWNEA